MALARNHEQSIKLESLCRRIVKATDQENIPGGSAIAGSFNADRIDNGGLHQALCVAFATKYSMEEKSNWSKVEELLSKYESSRDNYADSKEEYQQIVVEATDEAKKLAQELQYI